jgi:formylmethanofuran dehydrogenase subunit C
MPVGMEVTQVIKLLWKGSSDRIPIEAECIRSDLLAQMSLSEIERLEVRKGNEKTHLGDFFEVTGEPSEDVHITGDTSLVKWIGTNMESGSITIEGDSGMHLGSGMKGGTITVHGNAGDWLGAEIRGGVIHVCKDAGNMVGSTYPGSRFGCNGGTILVGGDAGDMAGARMRRGLVAIGGRAGDFAGAEMIAGTIVIFGGSGICPGAGLKRGTVILYGPCEGDLLETFAMNCRFRSPYFAILLKYLAGFDMPVKDEFLHGEYLRYSGDEIYFGKGEIAVFSG